jgi:hypothetical protein
MIYIIYDVESIGNHQGYIEEIGGYLGLKFGKFDESLLPYIKMIDCLVVPEKVAMAYKFAGKLKGSTSVRPGTTQYDQLGEDVLEVYKDKFKYHFTEEDKVNATLCAQATMHYLLNKYYYNKIAISMATPKMFRDENWTSEHVLIEKKKMVMSEIDYCQTMEDTVELLHNRFGIQKNDSAGDFKIDL